MVVTPAPTAASVPARTGYSRNNHIMDITSPYDIYIKVVVKRLLTTVDAIAHKMRKPKRIHTSNVVASNILIYPLIKSFLELFSILFCDCCNFHLGNHVRRNRGCEPEEH